MIPFDGWLLASASNSFDFNPTGIDEILESFGAFYFDEKNNNLCPITSYEKIMVTGTGSAITVDPTSGKIQAAVNQIYSDTFIVKACA